MTDKFIFEANSGKDRIRDFEDGIDKLDLTALGLSFEEVGAEAMERRAGLKLTFSEGNRAFISGMTLVELTEDGFV